MVERANWAMGFTILVSLLDYPRSFFLWLWDVSLACETDEGGRSR